MTEIKNEEDLKKLTELAEKGNAEAQVSLAFYYIGKASEKFPTFINAELMQKGLNHLSAAANNGNKEAIEFLESLTKKAIYSEPITESDPNEGEYSIRLVPKTETPEGKKHDK